MSGLGRTIFPTEPRENSEYKYKIGVLRIHLKWFWETYKYFLVLGNPFPDKLGVSQTFKNPLIGDYSKNHFWKVLQTKK